MMIFAIAVSTMITVALVVFAIQYHAYRKSQAGQNKPYTLKRPTVGTRGSQMAS